MTITGNHLIAGREVSPVGTPFHGVNPTTGIALEPAFADATEADADAALRAADEAFDALRLAAPRCVRICSMPSPMKSWHWEMNS